MHEIRLIDTTLRDGEQSAGLALSEAKKIAIAKILDQTGVFQIEAGIPAMGEAEKRSILRMTELGLKARISTWNRVLVEDVREAMRCGPVVIHVSVPSSELQMKRKLGKSKEWVLDCLSRCIFMATERGHEVTVGLEDASRADPSLLTELARKACSEGASMIRYADTIGRLHRRKALEDIGMLIRETSCDVGIHTHNDLGMAVANAIAAVEAGAVYVDTTAGGIGERAGNCCFLHFLQAARSISGALSHMELSAAAEAEKEILRILQIQKQ